MKIAATFLINQVTISPYSSTKNPYKAHYFPEQNPNKNDRFVGEYKPVYS